MQEGLAVQKPEREREHDYLYALSIINTHNIGDTSNYFSNSNTYNYHKNIPSVLQNVVESYCLCLYFISRHFIRLNSAKAIQTYVVCCCLWSLR